MRQWEKDELDRFRDDLEELVNRMVNVKNSVWLDAGDKADKVILEAYNGINRLFWALQTARDYRREKNRKEQMGK